MTLTIDITPEMETRLQQEAAKHGQETSEFVRSALEFLLAGRETETDASAFADIRAMSQKTLLEYWLNDEDAVYDTL